VCRSGQASKRKFEVYVCSAADRPWALEAWRLLDPHGDLIPHDQRPRRLFSKKDNKVLAQVLNLGRLPSIHGAPLSVYDRVTLSASRIHAQKSCEQCCSVCEHDQADAAAALICFSWGTAGGDRSDMPLAIIVDDRVEVGFRPEHASMHENMCRHMQPRCASADPHPLPG